MTEHAPHALAADLQDLIDRRDLQQLALNYSRAIDRRDFALLESLYHPDAIETHGDMFQGAAPDYIKWVEQALSRYAATAHYVVNALYVVAGDRAEGEIYKINYHRTLDDPAREVITGSRSLDRYEKRNGEWRFSARSVTLDWAQERAANAEAYRNFAAGSPPGRPGGDDLSYALLDLFRRGGQPK